MLSTNVKLWLKKFSIVRRCLQIIRYIREEREISSLTAKKPEGLMINIGAGEFKHKNWINLDYVSEWYRTIQVTQFIPYDIRNDTISLDNETVFCAYSSHVIEHIESNYVEIMFKEVHRVLKVNGIFRLCFPDADFLYHVTLQNHNYWYWRLKWFNSSRSSVKRENQSIPSLDCLVREIATPKSNYYRNAIHPIATETLSSCFKEYSQKDFLNFLIEGLEFRSNYPGDHINWWNFEKCKTILNKVGFKTVLLSKYQGSITPYMRGNSFDKTSPCMSCYVEAIK